jgi:hypothetical protein
MKRLVGLAAGVLVLASGACSQAPECDTTLVGGTTCVPDMAQANTALTLQARPSACGSTCNGTVEFVCRVQVNGLRVEMTLDQTICTEPEKPTVLPQSCPTLCQIPDALNCVVPALAEGDYLVSMQGNPTLNLLVRPTGAVQCEVMAF